MTDLALVYLQLLLATSRFRRRNDLSLLLCVYAVFFLPTVVTGDRSAFIIVEQSPVPVVDPVPAARAEGLSVSLESVEEWETTARDSIHRPSNEGSGRINLQGSFVRAGAIKNVEGELRKIPFDGCDQKKNKKGGGEEHMSESQTEEWVAVLEVPVGRAKAEHDTSACQSVLDKVRKAMLLGASAIIILAINQKMVTELDISQLFPRPIVLIKEVENVTALLSALASKISMKVRMTCNASFYDLQHNVSTLALWTTCGRSSAVRSYGVFDGVICLGNPGGVQSKEDPGQFWSYFFSGLSILILLFLIKARHSPDDNTRMQAKNSIQRLSQYALARMRVRRYRRGETRNHDDSDRDTCAVCLDAFNKKQKIRVLPCLHEFHVTCVDPWLLSHQTCPLCKLNIIDQQIKLDAM